MKKIFLILLLILSFVDCGLTKAPQVNRSRIKSANQEITGSSLGTLCEEFSTFSGACGSVKANLKIDTSESEWVFWKAGSNEIIFDSTKEFLESDQWDLRITKAFPVFGSNGGSTAENVAYPSGKASVGEWNGSISSVEWVSDIYGRLIYNGEPFGSLRDQNPLLNEIGKGITKSYTFGKPILNNEKIFVLRDVTGTRFFLIRFRSFSSSEMILVWDWKEIQSL